ncbi:MAG TPA: NUDIX domain-containing protein [Polyangia bacterium]|nr:NUDIX domain-containing protein [Polyangia bacterium]
MSRLRSEIICTVDVVLLTLDQDRLKLALLRRDRDPFRHVLTLPGGFVHADDDDDAEAAARRVLREKAGIVCPYLEQLGAFSGRARDPRGWSVSVVYFALVPSGILQRPRSSALTLVGATQVRNLPFDHQAIVAAALARIRSKSTYSSLPVHLCGPTFTLPRLQAVYEAVLGQPLNKVTFRRKLEELAILEPVEGSREGGRAHRPAQLYRLKDRYQGRLMTSPRALNLDAAEA